MLSSGTIYLLLKAKKINHTNANPYMDVTIKRSPITLYRQVIKKNLLQIIQFEFQKPKPHPHHQ